MTAELDVTGGSILIMYETRSLSKDESFKVYLDGAVALDVKN